MTNKEIIDASLKFKQWITDLHRYPKYINDILQGATGLEVRKFSDYIKEKIETLRFQISNNEDVLQRISKSNYPGPSTFIIGEEEHIIDSKKMDLQKIEREIEEQRKRIKILESIQIQAEFWIQEKEIKAIKEELSKLPLSKEKINAINVAAFFYFLVEGKHLFPAPKRGDFENLLKEYNYSHGWNWVYILYRGLSSKKHHADDSWKRVDFPYVIDSLSDFPNGLRLARDQRYYIDTESEDDNY